MSTPSWVGSPETTPLQKQIYDIMDEGGMQFHKACRIAEEIEAGALKSTATDALLALYDAVDDYIYSPSSNNAYPDDYCNPEFLADLRTAFLSATEALETEKRTRADIAAARGMEDAAAQEKETR